MTDPKPVEAVRIVSTEDYCRALADHMDRNGGGLAQLFQQALKARDVQITKLRSDLEAAQERVRVLEGDITRALEMIGSGEYNHMEVEEHLTAALQQGAGTRQGEERDESA